MMKDILRKLRKYEIKIRKSVNTQMKGEYHSVFKGSGLEFDDLREYSYGDDLRTINWNVTAKGQGTFINTYKEEKEQNVFVVLDVSASQEIGREGKQKIDLGREVACLMAFAALKEQSSVGLLCYSDQKERYVKPGKGMKHGAQILKAVYELEPKSTQTDLRRAMGMALNMIKRKSIIVFVSDFIDEDYNSTLRAMANMHDLILVHLTDQREGKMPSLGIVPFEDKESGKILWKNTSAKNFRRQLRKDFVQSRHDLEQLTRRFNANYLPLNTGEDFEEDAKGTPGYVHKMIQLFRLRNHTGR